jgi:hypothetical protein
MNSSQGSAKIRWGVVLARREEIISREIAGETILVPIRGKLVDLQRIFALNPVAAHIWQGLDGEKNLAEIRDSVLDVFEVERDRADADIQEFVAELLDAELVEEVP